MRMYELLHGFITAIFIGSTAAIVVGAILIVKEIFK